MQLVPTLLNVRGDEVIERAIASEITSLDEKDLTRDFLEEMSSQYTPTPGPKKTIVENPDTQDKE